MIPNFELNLIFFIDKINYTSIYYLYDYSYLIKSTSLKPWIEIFIITLVMSEAAAVLCFNFLKFCILIHLIDLI